MIIKDLLVLIILTSNQICSDAALLPVASRFVWSRCGTRYIPMLLAWTSGHVGVLASEFLSCLPENSARTFGGVSHMIRCLGRDELLYRDVL
jgi:hypothetical protein